MTRFPGVHPSAEIKSFEDGVSINDDGDIATVLECRQGSCGTSQDTGVVFANGTVDLVAREHTGVPGLGGVDFANFDNDNAPVANDMGGVAFTAPFDNGSSGILIDDGMGNFDLIVQEGDIIDGFTIGNLDGVSIGYNDSGSLVFLADDGMGGQALIEWDPVSMMFDILAQTGDEVPGTGGATIIMLFLPHGTGFNDAGQVAVWAELSDGSNNILMDAEGIPEPGTLILLGGSALCLVAARRQRRQKTH